MQIESATFVRLRDDNITQYTLTNDAGMSLSFLTFGARVSRVRLPDRDGHNPNLTLGYITFQDYINEPGLFGATVGPVFGSQGDLPENSGRTGWQNWNWQAATAQDDTHVQLRLTLNLPDGADGLPGQRRISVLHTLDQDNHWTIDWHVETTAAIPCRPLINIPFVLTGDPAQTVMSQKLRLDAERVALPTDRPVRSESQTASLIGKKWSLSLETDAKGLEVTTFPEVGETNCFNGILGQPHVAVGIRPQNGNFMMTPDRPFDRQTIITLHRLQ
ncbi:aldose epimerase [Lacticaseibacillus parakribbianus]|uniref:aldose epimerase family protein n=1 Tax=Lacticaseibacillus parakribbianus TaxID=2970927 RepID=UPI0021CB7EBA|nr:aldose epimerase [Lacticaseibacillus parakribbianus]